MRTGTLTALGLTLTLGASLTLLRGQDPAPKPAEPKLTPTQVQLQHTARRGADWLSRMHGLKGRFLPGYLPALKQELEGDNLPRQASAAAGLARAARHLGVEGYGVQAAQTALTLLEDTSPDPAHPTRRVISLPGDPASRMGMAAGLALAIHELPSPQPDLLERAEQLLGSVRAAAKADGAMGDADLPTAGIALWAVIKSHKARPAAWKPALVSRGLAFYRAVWAKTPRTDAAHALCAACAEMPGDKAAAGLALEVADWVCGLQYVTLDRRRMAWFGGFMAFREGRPCEETPDATAGSLAAALAEACRAARDAGDPVRLARYTGSLEQALQFLVALQYTDAGTQHFAAWYRPKVVGGFHRSPTDGDLRIDHTADAVTALIGYVEHAAR